jgi:uncharacterized protein
MRYLVTGGTGFVGRALCAQLAAERREVTVLTRDPDAAARLLHPGIRVVSRLSDCGPVDTVINLQGENLSAGRWTTARKLTFRTSRIDFTRALVEWMGTRTQRPSALINASAIGWYGDRGDEVLTESSTGGNDFAATLCADWEAEARKAEALGLRVCRVRIGVVLDRDGGALAKMLPAFRMGAGGPLGPGTQWMSWITRRDLVRLLRWLAESSLYGVFNGVAPGAVRNAEFSRLLGRALKRPAVLPMPAFMLRAMFGEMSGLLLGSQRVMPDASRACGFSFEHPTLDAALDAVVR